jgi:DNA polymerase I-like protein with 3'-5' exonuclease and polymerase domains
MSVAVETKPYKFQMEAGDYEYTVEWYQPGVSKPITGAPHLGIDSETEMIIKGADIVPVIAQICDHERRYIQIVHSSYWKDYFYALYLNNPEAVWIFHNAPFDIDVIGDPRYKCPFFMDLLQNKRIVDTQLRFVLSEMKKGTFMGLSSLDYACGRLLKVEVDKDKEIRLTFKLMDGDQYWIPSAEHLFYAAMDAAYTSQLYLQLPYELPTEDVSLYGKIALADISKRGLLVDPDERERLYNKINGEIRDTLQELEYFNWRPGDGSAKELQRRLEFMEEAFNIRLPRTKGKKGKKGYYDENNNWVPPVPRTPGQIKTTDEALEEVPDDYTFVKLYKAYTHKNKMVSTYLKDNSIDLETNLPMYDRIGMDGRVHSFFNDMVKTGRTSCRGPNIQNVPRDEGLRGIYKAREGYVLFACDYSQAELCALAQNCYTRYGFSKMMEIINGGRDLHMWLGEQIFLRNGGTDAEWEALPSKDHDGPTGDLVRGKKFYRQLSKALNFGKPGGLSAPTFVTYAKGYGVELTVDEADDLLNFWVESFPEMEYHLNPPPDGEGKAKNDDGDWESFQAYRGETITGRIRSKSGYCAACNYSFQGLVADGIKWAMWYLWQEGFPMVNMIHDEVVFELKEDDPELQTKIARIKELMLYGMRLVLPDITGLQCEGSLMRRWRKEAEELLHPIYGTPLIWEDCKEFGWVKDGELFIPEELQKYSAPPKAKVY